MPPSIEAKPARVIDLAMLQPFCRLVRFAPGDVLRRKGLHYKDMYLIADGAVEVGETGGVAPLKVRGAGFPIGEIGFLRGCPALATVTASTPVEALLVDDPALARLEQEQPVATAQLLRRLAEIAEERTSYNLVLASTVRGYAAKPAIDVYLCRNRQMLENAQRLRYEVYCLELGRQSPYADHDRKIITDHLDESGHVFIAVEAGETIATLRANRPTESALGPLEELYGMRRSPHHPHATVVCTKFIVRKSKRSSQASLKLISGICRYGLRHGIEEIYIDAIPALLPYYKALGFTINGEKFFHRENGPSHPMVLDFARHGERLSSEPGLRTYLSLMVRALAIKWIDKVRGTKSIWLP
jgi:CRP-like cAMP-binding protein